mmetsp:Transcript_3351/g.8680  ORF Transcript_3351/g.8680 Transcript_3351/m.8680 type:complete len:240 (+) Transcript_3351:458-1177(+)
MVRGEGSRRPLPMDQEGLDDAVHLVPLHLGDVVTHVVHEVHVHVLRRTVEHPGEGPSGEVRHARPVRPGVVGRARHGREIILPLPRVDARARQLPVVQRYAVPRHGPLHDHEGVRRDLMSESARSRMDHDAHLTDSADPHPLRGRLVVYLVHHLHLGVVIPRPESAQLRQSSLLRSLGHLAGIGRHHPPVLLAVLLVLRPGVPLLQRPVDARVQDLVQIPLRHGYDPLRPDADGDVIEQ